MKKVECGRSFLLILLALLWHSKFLHKSHKELRDGARNDCSEEEGLVGVGLEEEGGSGEVFQELFSSSSYHSIRYRLVTLDPIFLLQQLSAPLPLSHLLRNDCHGKEEGSALFHLLFDKVVRAEHESFFLALLKCLLVCQVGQHFAHQNKCPTRLFFDFTFFPIKHNQKVRIEGPKE